MTADLLQRIWQIFNWVIDNPGDTTILGVFALILRKIVLFEIERVIQMGRDEELVWTRTRVETLTGEKWNGPRPILKRVQIHYIVKYYSYLLVGSKRVYLLRRGKRMQINKAWLSGVVAYILGQLALKYGFTWNDAWSDTVTDIIITFAIPLIVAFLNRTKKKEAVSVEPHIYGESNK